MYRLYRRRIDGMFVIGLDIGLKSIGMVLYNNGYVSVLDNDTNLGLSVESDINEIKEIADSIALNIPDSSIVLVDNTKNTFKSRKGQRENLNTLIGCIAGNTYDCQFFRVEPSEVRKAYGLNAKASKEDVWSSISNSLYEQIEKVASEHVKDALALVDVWVNHKDEIEVW